MLIAQLWCMWYVGIVPEHFAGCVVKAYDQTYVETDTILSKNHDLSFVLI